MCPLPHDFAGFLFMEIWKDIKGYEGYYQVSNLGRVKSLDRVATYSDKKVHHLKGRVLKPMVTKHGYEIVDLRKDRKRKTSKVHRLVAIAFLDNPKNKPQVNHIDGVKLNNNLNNLEWVTNAENIRHAYKKGLINTAKGERHAQSKITKEQVLEIRDIYSKGGLTQEQVGQLFGIDQTHVSDIVNKRSWTHI